MWHPVTGARSAAAPSRATIQARAAAYVADLWVHLRVGRNLRTNSGSQGGPVAYVRTVFAVYEVASVTQPRLFPGATSRAYDPAAQRLVSYLVSTMPPGNVRVSIRFRLTQLSSAVKNGVPPPTKTG